VDEPAGESWTRREAERALDDRGRLAQSSSHGFARGPVWLRVDLPWMAEEGVLEIPYPTLDRVDVWIDERHWRVGDREPASQRAIDHPTYAFPSSPGARTALVRAESSGALAVPIRHWSRPAFERHRALLPLGLGLFYGFLLALALYNAFLALSLRSRPYGFYALWLFALALSQAGFAGHAGQWLWPTSTWAVNALPTVFLCVSAGAGNLFLHALLELPARAPRSGKVIFALAIGFFAVALGLLVAYAAVVPAVLALGLVDLVVLTVVLVAGVRRRQRAAYFLAIGAACFIPWYGLFAVATQGLVPMGFWARHGLKVGTCLEALILAFALADRVRILERAKLVAQRALSRGLLAAQDGERRRIASELHDGVGQSLSVLAGGLRGEAAERARGCVDELRRMAHELHPDRLERLGLRDACARVVEETLDRAGLEYEHGLEAVDGRLPRPVALHVYRVLQEALTNLVRHADASWASVTLRSEGDWVVLRVDDDGRGLGDRPRGLGLSSMEERARASAGRLVVGDRSAGGTRIELFVPGSEHRCSAC
jgi:signal transduction histidine kinase